MFSWTCKKVFQKFYELLISSRDPNKSKITSIRCYVILYSILCLILVSFFSHKVVGLHALSQVSLLSETMWPKRNFVARQNVRCENASNECAKVGFWHFFISQFMKCISKSFEIKLLCRKCLKQFRMMEVWQI